MIGKLGMPEILILLAIALLIFGPRKIAELGKGFGDGIRGFKSAIQGDGEKVPNK
jgi:sec-independent protein translocase protein TatA